MHANLLPDWMETLLAVMILPTSLSVVGLIVSDQFVLQVNRKSQVKINEHLHFQDDTNLMVSVINDMRC